MLLSVRLLKDVNSVNSWEIDDHVSWVEGSSLTVYFQLIDASLDSAPQGYFPAGRRYVAADGATLSVTLENVNDAKKLVRPATQPFPGDKSIWALQILSTDKIRGSPQMRLVLTEGAVITNGFLKSGIKILSLENC